MCRIVMLLPMASCWIAGQGLEMRHDSISHQLSGRAAIGVTGSMMDAALLFSHLCFIFFSNISQTLDEPDFFHCPSPWIPVSCPAQVPVEHCLLAHRSLQVPACSLAIPPRDLAVLWSLTSYSTFPIFGFVSPAGFILFSCSLNPGSALQAHPLVGTFSTHLLVLVLMTSLLFLICPSSLCHF